MKTEIEDVNETRKHVRVEIDSAVVDAEIDRHARDYSRKARVPGFRPGKVPPRVIKQRYKDQILHDVANDLIPRAVDDALREHGVEAVDTPDVRDVQIEEGRPLTFTASFDTVPSFDPGDLSTISLRRSPVNVTDEAVDQALQRLRERAARFEPVEGRGIIDGDTVVMDLDREPGETGTKESGPSGPPSKKSPEERGEVPPSQASASLAVAESGGRGPHAVTKDSRSDVSIELGGKANPPGFDEQLLGLEPGATKTFTIQYPSDYPNGELAGSAVSYTVKVKNVKRRLLPELDDELAKDLGEFDTLDALRAQVREDLNQSGRQSAERDVRAELMKQLATRLPFGVPSSLVEREIERRTEDFARRLLEQRIDPRQAGVDWGAFRDSQRDVAKESVAAALVLDEVTTREGLVVTDNEVEREIERYAEGSGRTPAAVRAALEKEGGLARVAAGLRREKSVDFVMARAKIMEGS
jgi:trigger factor